MCTSVFIRGWRLFQGLALNQINMVFKLEFWWPNIWPVGLQTKWGGVSTGGGGGGEVTVLCSRSIKAAILTCQVLQRESSIHYFAETSMIVNVIFNYPRS